MIFQPTNFVGLAQVLAGAQPFRERNVNDTFRGTIKTAAGDDRPAVIKDLLPKELANEVLMAAIGLQLGLPVPPPFVALASPDRLPAKKGPEVSGAGRLLFASTDVSQPQVATYLSGGANRRVAAQLSKWGNLGRTYGFDALIANVDRHAGNLLFNGDREVWLIDHGHSLTGPAWKLTDLIPSDKTVRHRLSEWLTPFLDPTERMKAAGEAKTIEEALRQVSFDLLARANHVEDLLVAGDFEAAMTFLNERLVHVPRLAAAACNVLVA